MALKFLEVAVIKVVLYRFIVRVGMDYVASAFQLLRSLQRREFHLAADVLSSLTPLKLYGFTTQFAYNVFSHTQACIFHVHLDYDVTLAVSPSLVSLNPSPHLRRLNNFAVFYLTIRVHATDVLTDDHVCAAERRAYSHRVPVDPGDLGGTQSAGEKGDVHLYLAFSAYFCRDIHRSKYCCIGIRLNPYCANTGTVDVEMGEIQWIILFRASRDFRERLRIKNLSSP